MIRLTDELSTANVGDMDIPWVDRLLSDLEQQAETERLLERDV